MIAFWILAPIMVLAALGILFVRKAVHAALLLAVVMISLAVLYAALEAPFLFAVQIIVYTGAILMLFLFVLMLVGVDASDSVVETIRGQRLFAILAGLILGVTLVAGVGQLSLGTVVGLDKVNKDGNIEALANILFSRYVFAFEVTSALLITAAMGAMVLAHRERLTPKPTQAQLAAERVRAYAESGLHPGPLPPPACSPGTTRWTRRHCCPTGPLPRRRSPACSRPAARSAPPRATSRRYSARSTTHPTAYRTPRTRPTAARRSRAAARAPAPDRPARTRAPRPAPPPTKAGTEAMDSVTPFIVLSAILFTIGSVGVLTRRNAIVVFMCVELMLNASNLALVAFAKQHGDLDGQIAAFFVMVVAAAEVVVGLAIIMTIFRTRRSASVDDASLLKY